MTCPAWKVRFVLIASILVTSGVFAAASPVIVNPLPHVAGISPVIVNPLPHVANTSPVIVNPLPHVA